MKRRMDRRQFFQVTTAGAGLWLFAPPFLAHGSGSPLISPGCRGTKVRVAKVYLGMPHALWPTPAMDLAGEMARYEQEFQSRPGDFGDVDFAVSELVTKKEQAAQLAERLADVDGILAIHLSMGVTELVRELLKAGRPTVLFAAPYSGHEWTGFGALERAPEGARLSCMLTSDMGQLAAAVRPFRAIHHLREAKLLNVTANEPKVEFLKTVKDKFGTSIVRIDRDRTLAAYESIAPAAAEAEAERWIAAATAVVEPSRDEIVRSCRLALAFERLLEEENGTAITVDCYGSMYHKLPAFPCIGFTRLNDMGFAGICESDLTAAMTFLVMQGLSGKPGFISDPTVDESKGAIILAHCLGSTKMDGPNGESCPYRIRTIMERQEGAVTQVSMKQGQRVTQAVLVGADMLRYFTGDIIDVPDTERGCRTKITVKVDGDIGALWRHWAHGLHRVTCYGDLTADLNRFCRFEGIQLIDEAKAVEA